MASGWVKNSFLADEVGPGQRVTVQAGGNITPYSPVKWSGAKVVACAANDLDCVGMAVSDEAKILNDDVIVALSGSVVGIADTAIAAGDQIKVGGVGKVMAALAGSNAGATIEDNVGSSFANQPANDGVELVSSSTVDTMPVDIWGTTNGGVVVVKERVVLTGTTQASTVKTDWGVILGVEIPEGYPTSAGTITVREASGNATIITISAGTRQVGVVNVPANKQRTFNRIISVVADSTSTKTVGVVGTGFTANEQKEAVVLTSAVKKNFLNPFRTVTKLLVGDLETARTVTFKTDTLMDNSLAIIGRAKTAALAGEEVEFEFVKDTRQAGLLFVASEASNPIAATSSATSFSNSVCSLGANAVKKGSVIRFKGQGIATATNSTDTLAITLNVGGQTVLTIPATDVADNDIFAFEFDLIGRADPGATAACVGIGNYVIGAAGTATRRSAILASTNLATNAAMAVDVKGTWSTSGANSCRLDIFTVEVL